MVVAKFFECFEGQCQRSKVKGQLNRNRRCMSTAAILVIMTMGAIKVT